MARIEKTVFISYRRTNVPWALAISQNLTHHGFDVFFDFTGLASGDFEGVILDNIHARAHFLVLLTPSALESCGEPGDWLRREIEEALDSKRNIVPLMLEGFEFDTRSIANQLTGKLANLRKYNAMTVPAEYFEAAMEKLRNNFLNVALDTVLQPASAVAVQAASKAKEAAAQAPLVPEEELTAQQWFERGFNAHLKNDLGEALQDYDRAIRLKPDFDLALYNRGLVRRAKADLDGAIEDLNRAIDLDPDFSEAINNRGITRYYKRDLQGAIRDFNKAILLRPDFGEAFYNRGLARHYDRDPQGAIRDYNKAIRLGADFREVFYSRAEARQARGDLSGALTDFKRAIRVDPNYSEAIAKRTAVLQAIEKLDANSKRKSRRSRS